jgi:sec-independent protein translocase protein TatA
MDALSPWHIILILLVVVLLFGGRKIPEMMKGLGEGIREFKKASQVNNEPEKKEDTPSDEENKTSGNLPQK